MALDRDTGRVLSDAEAEEAAANPHIYTWVIFTD